MIYYFCCQSECRTFNNVLIVLILYIYILKYSLMSCVQSNAIKLRNSRLGIGAPSDIRSGDSQSRLERARTDGTVQLTTAQ